MSSLLIAENHVVTVHYTLHDTTPEGEVIESTLNDEPLAFIYGVGAMIPDFEKQLTGMKTGDSFAFGIGHEKAYGVYEAEARTTIERKAFALTKEQEEMFFQVGRMLPLQDNDGNQLDGIVAELTDESVTVDFNHPMAGVDLYFVGTVVEVRMAEPMELEHGHVHGPGDHAH